MHREPQFPHKIVTLPKFDRSLYEAAIAAGATSRSKADLTYLGEVNTRSLVNIGVELPIPYQLEMRNHFYSRLDNNAWDKLVMKSF